MDKQLLDAFLHTYKFEDTSRQDTNLHVSDLVDCFCPRKYALCIKNNTPFHVKKWLSVAQSFTFEIGRAFQSIVVSRYKKAGILIGTWRCLSCGRKYFGIGDKCPNCSREDLLKYEDTTLVLDKYGVDVVGNVDILAVRPPNEIVAVEVKSIKPDSFDTLTEPELMHTRQISLYLWLLKTGAKIACKHSNINIADYKFNTSSGVVKYCSKTYKQMPFKTFKVTPNPQLLAEVESKLRIVKKFTKDGKIPKAICTSKSNLMARNCSCRDTCFTKA
jgi:hypothetical protein